MLALVRALIFSEKINMAAPMVNFYFQLIAFAFLHQVRLKSFHAIKGFKTVIYLNLEKNLLDVQVLADQVLIWHSVISEFHLYVIFGIALFTKAI